MSLPDSLADALRGAPANVRWFLLGSLLLGTGVGVFDVLLNLHLQEEGLTKAAIGEILSQRAIGTVLGSIAAGLPVVRARFRAVLTCAALLVAAAMAILVLADSALGRQAAATAFGFGVTFRLLGAAPFLFRHVPDASMARLFGIDAAVIAGSQVAGCVLAGASFGAAEAWTGSRPLAHRVALLLGAALVVGGAVVYARVRDDAAPAHDPRGLGPGTPARATRLPPASLVFRLCIPFFLVGAGAGFTIPYLNLYFEDRFEAAPSTIALFYAAVSSTTMIGYLASPWLAARFGLVRSVVWAEWLSIPAFLVLAWSNDLGLSVVAFLVRGALMNLPYPLYGNFIMRMVPAHQREATNALTKLAWNGSWVVTARIAGGLLQGRGDDYAPVMLTTAALYLAASLSFWAFFRRTGL